MKRKKTSKVSEEKLEPAAKAQILNKEDFQHIKFTHTQLNFFKAIKKNFLTVCTGPAGCLTKNEKIRGYIVRSKKKKRDIHEEKDS